MEMDIVIKEWKVKTGDNKQKTIGGIYQVRLGNQVVSESTFNDVGVWGYQTTDINIPPEIMVEVEAIDAKVKQAIIDNFTK